MGNTLFLEEKNTFQADNSEIFKSNINERSELKVSIKINHKKTHNRTLGLIYRGIYVSKFPDVYVHNNLSEIIVSNDLIKTITSNGFKKITLDSSNAYAKNNNETLNIITQKESLKKMKSIKNIKYDWDGYGGEPMNPEIYSNAYKLIEKVIIPPRVFPTANGTIQFEYHKKNNDDEYLEFEIFNSNIKVLFMRSDDDYKEYTYNINDINKINNLIKEFYYGVN